VKDIVYVVKGGRYIRNLHRWAGYGMVIAGFLHLIRVFLLGDILRGVASEQGFHLKLSKGQPDHDGF
jgi:hypothetical protein